MWRDGNLDVSALHPVTQVFCIPLPDSMPVLGAAPDDKGTVSADIAHELQGGGFRGQLVEDGGIQFVIGGD